MNYDGPAWKWPAEASPFQRESPAGEQVISFVLAIVRTIDLTLGKTGDVVFIFFVRLSCTAHLCLCVTQIGGVLWVRSQRLYSRWPTSFFHTADSSTNQMSKVHSLSTVCVCVCVTPLWGGTKKYNPGGGEYLITRTHAGWNHSCFFHQQFSRASYIASVTHLMDIEKPNTGTQPVKLSRRFFSLCAFEWLD